MRYKMYLDKFLDPQAKSLVTKALRVVQRREFVNPRAQRIQHTQNAFCKLNIRNQGYQTHEIQNKKRVN